MNEKHLRLRAADVFVRSENRFAAFCRGVSRYVAPKREKGLGGIGSDASVSQSDASVQSGGQAMPHLPAHKRKLRPRTPASRGRRRAAAFHMRWSRDTPLCRRVRKSADAFCFFRKGRGIDDRQAAAQALAPHTPAFSIRPKRTITLPPRSLLRPNFCSAGSKLCGARR